MFFTGKGYRLYKLFCSVLKLKIGRYSAAVAVFVAVAAVFAAVAAVAFADFAAAVFVGSGYSFFSPRFRYCLKYIYFILQFARNYFNYAKGVIFFERAVFKTSGRFFGLHSAAAASHF